MQHDRTVFFTVFTHIGCVKTFRQNKVRLKRATLPVTANRIAQNKFKFRTVKSAFTRIDLKCQTGFFSGFTKGGFGLVPNLV